MAHANVFPCKYKFLELSKRSRQVHRPASISESHPPRPALSLYPSMQIHTLFKHGTMMLLRYSPSEAQRLARPRRQNDRHNESTRSELGLTTKRPSKREVPFYRRGRMRYPECLVATLELSPSYSRAKVSVYSIKVFIALASQRRR